MAQINPMQLIQMIKNGQNPQQLMMSILQQRMGQTPVGQNLMTMMQNNQGNQIEAFVRNLCQSRGMDFDKEFAIFKQQLGL